MQKCPYLENCPIFNKFKSEALKNIWIANYCNANFNACQRKELRDTGEVAPPTMLPNGTHLSSLSD